MTTAEAIIDNAHAMSDLAGENMIQRAGVWVECAKQLAAALAKTDKENLVLRAMLSKLSPTCPHCGIEDITECASGFPGCAQADDLLAGTDESFKALAAQRNLMKGAIERITRRAGKRDTLSLSTFDLDDLRAAIRD